MIKIINKIKNIISIICLNFLQHLSADVIVQLNLLPSPLSLLPIDTPGPFISDNSRWMFCNSYTFSVLPFCSPGELIINYYWQSSDDCWSESLAVWGVGWSGGVTKWHLMREDDDHELEIVITRSHSLLCFLTASIQNRNYQSIFQCKLSWFNNRNTEDMFDRV